MEISFLFQMKRGSSVAQHEVIPLPSGIAGHLIPVPLPKMWLLGGFQLPRHLPLTLASIMPLLLGTLGHHGPVSCARLGCPVGRDSILLAFEKLAHAHILLLWDCHAQNRVSSPLSWGWPQRGIMQRGRCSASFTGNHQSSKTSACLFFFFFLRGGV